MAREILWHPESKTRHDALHHLGPSDTGIDAEPYLTLPFNKQELIDWIRHVKDPSFNQRRLYNISEGTMYSAAERKIHGKTFHAAIDFDVPYGTPVAAPVSGYIRSSYESYWLKHNGQQVVWKGKSIAFGLGYFIELYNPQTNRFLQIGHLSDIDEAIPFSPPLLDTDGDWAPTNLNVSIETMIAGNHPFVGYVERGQAIGRVGWSGLRWGYDEYPVGADRPVWIDPTMYISYDESHAHVEEFFRDQETGLKTPRRDMYDIYLSGDQYPTPTRQRLMGPEPLLHLGFNELPKFADDFIG